jgi:hypothetical protein
MRTVAERLDQTVANGMAVIHDQDAFSVEDFARRHGIGRTLVYDEIREGRLVARKVRSRTLVTAEDARAWRENLPKAGPQAA